MIKSWRRCNNDSRIRVFLAGLEVTELFVMRIIAKLQ